MTKATAKRKLARALHWLQAGVPNTARCYLAELEEAGYRIPADVYGQLDESDHYRNQAHKLLEKVVL